MTPQWLCHRQNYLTFGLFFHLQFQFHSIKIYPLLLQNHIAIALFFVIILNFFPNPNLFKYSSCNLCQFFSLLASCLLSLFTYSNCPSLHFIQLYNGISSIDAQLFSCVSNIIFSDPPFINFQILFI